MTASHSKKKRKPAERVGDKAYVVSRFWYLARCRTFDEYLARCKEIRELEEYQRLTRYNKGEIDWRMKQCSPVLATDDANGGRRGWERGTRTGYFIDGKFVECHSKELKKYYDRINKEDIPCKSAWTDCPFDKELNGQEY